MKTQLLVALVATAGLGAACTKKEPPVKDPVQRVNADTLEISDEAMKNLRVAKAAMGDFPETLNLMGRIGVAEDRMVVVPARVSGRIESVYRASGESVTKGETLASIFSPDFISAREEYLQSLKQSNSPDEMADLSNLPKMARKKLQSLGLADQDIDKLRQAGNDSPNMILRAPRAGAIIDKKAVVGNLVNIGDTLFTIADLGKVWFSGDLYPEDLGKVHKDQPLAIESPNGGPPILGKVSFISPVIDPTARTIKIRALVDNPKLLLRADMYVQGSLTLNVKQALLIPTSAVIRVDNKNYCFKKVAGNRYQKIPVKRGGERNGVLEVDPSLGPGDIKGTQGLQPGDEVISDGALLLDAALSSSEH